jgi:hypothetical protein
MLGVLAVPFEEPSPSSSSVARATPVKQMQSAQARTAFEQVEGMAHIQVGTLAATCTTPSRMKSRRAPENKLQMQQFHGSQQFSPSPHDSISRRGFSIARGY